MREQQSKQRHSSGEEGRLSKASSVESTATKDGATDSKPGLHPKVKSLPLTHSDRRSFPTNRMVTWSLVIRLAPINLNMP